MEKSNFKIPTKFAAQQNNPKKSDKSIVLRFIEAR